jgi:hypothetical protein
VSARDVDYLREIQDVLYPDGDRDAQWQVDTVERVADIIDAWHYSEGAQ